MEFILEHEDIKKVHEWQKRVWSEYLAKHPELRDPDFPEYPYMGAIGGGTTYSFTPTSLGVIVKVHDALTKEVLDLSDYDSW